MESLLTEKDLAKRLAVPVETIRTWRREGRGPRALKLERLVRYHPGDVEAWLEANASRVAS